MNILFHYESLAIGGQQTQTLIILKEICRRGEVRLFFIYNYSDDLAAEFSKYSTLIKIPTQIKAKDYLKPWKIALMIYGTVVYLKKYRIEKVVSGSGLGSFICGIAARICGIKHYRIIGCSLASVEKTLYKFYTIIGVDKLIDGYFGWPAVFDELKAKGVSERKFIHTIGSVDTDYFYPLPQNEILSLKVKYNLPKDKMIIGWVGRISYDMQIKFTIEMCYNLLESGFDQFHLLIVGGGSWFDGMNTKLHEYNLTSHTTVTNWVHPSEVNGLLNCMDIVPLLEEDPQGGSIIREAMACGKLALSVNGISGTQSSFMKADATILVDPASFIRNATNEIIKIHDNREILSTKGLKAREYAESKLSFTSQVDIILETLKNE